MTTHLSVRLAWHDRGWDARICDAPNLNTSCIVHEHIRDTRDDEKELNAAGTCFCDLKDWIPPCSRDSATYAEKGYTLLHRDPLDFRDLPPVNEEIPPYSCCPSPYRWMREENLRQICDSENLIIREPDKPRERGWVYEPDRQRELLKKFWDKIDPGRSLVFYYCNQGNPLDEDVSRIIVGVGRISSVGDQIYFGTKANYQDLYPVWSRLITQDYPQQGVRIPYQEYLQAGQSTERILCCVPQSALLSFSYVGEHVSDDVAVSVLERILQSIEQVKEDSVVAGDWDYRLSWLNDVLAEAWTNRGPFPGVGSVLQFLDFAKGTAYQRAVLAPMAKNGMNPWDHVLSILEGHKKPEKGPYESGFLKAQKKWSVLKARHELLAKLARFELSPDQVERIANPDMRARSGIIANEADLVSNPYIICESDLGTPNSEAISLETIDHGMLPEGNAALFPDVDEVAHDDPRRIRAVSHAVLKEAANSGDTVLILSDLLDRISKRFPERRACHHDRDLFVADRDFHSEILWTAFEEDPQLVALKDIHDLEQHIAGIVRRRSKKVNIATEREINWSLSLEKLFGKPANDREKTAFDEKQNALNTIISRRLSVLNGGAGTGKTSVLKVFLDELELAEGKSHILLLAPTGKARVRLSTKTRRKAMTIHQFLLREKWFMPDSFALIKESERDSYKATTVIIDECSMIPVDLLGTLLKALDMGPLKRLILVGDPNQLPPIGPGRPFVDIIEWLNKEHPECIASLNVFMRKDEEEGKPPEESVSLALAEGYRQAAVSPSDDEILADIAKGQPHGDLEVTFWANQDDLLTKIKNRMTELLGFKDGDYAGFNKSFGIDARDWRLSESWQILAPTRGQPFGTDNLNRLIQLEYKRGLIQKSQNQWSKMPRPFGDQEIVWTDKVIQIVNQSKRGWPQGAGLDYVANGEIGIVKQARKDNRGDYVDVVFSTQIDVSYRYYRSQVNENLELAYALTVHKAQGSDFDIVFLIVPQSASTLSRELIYTGLTRFRKKLVLLIEKDIGPLLRLRSPDCSDTRLRNTQMFALALRPTDVKRPHLEALIHRTRKGVAVRSKSEVVVADILESIGISYVYEEPLYSRFDPKDFRLPDFTVSFEGDTFYWEHLGMLNIPSYRDAWARKLEWYELNGFSKQLITSKDGPDGSIDATEIERTARERVLQE